jgi:phosphodiesterase/alkaline phosphatase D-like protein
MVVTVAVAADDASVVAAGKVEVVVFIADIIYETGGNMRLKINKNKKK